ncbi:MAG: hypothetical protein U1G07_22260 [Verrucomicrobiota bacterium]
MKEEADGLVRSFRRPLHLVEIHPPEILQAGALVLVEFEITLFQGAADRLPDFDMGACAHPEELLASPENLVLQMRATSQHALLVSVRVIAQRRSCRKYHNVLRLNKVVLVSANFFELSSPVRRIPEHLPLLVAEFSQRHRKFAESGTVADLKRSGFFCAAQGHRIRKTVVKHRFLLFRARDATQFRPVNKGQPVQKLQFGNEIHFGQKTENRPVIERPCFPVAWQSLAHEDDGFNHLRLLSNSSQQLAPQLAGSEGQDDQYSSPPFNAGCFFGRESFTPNEFRRT